MSKDKLQFIIYKYSWDKGYFGLLVIGLGFGLIFGMGIINDLTFVIPTTIFVVPTILPFINILRTRNNVKRNELVSLNLTNFKAFIKETKDSPKCGVIVIKLYIVNEDKKKYNYYYLTGSEIKFKEYKNVINQSSNVQLKLFKNTNIISSIIVDGEELKDLYYEIRYSKKLRKPIVYTHIKHKRTKKAIYKYEEYDIDDVQAVFEKAKLYEELYIINSDNKYVKISYNQENNSEFYIDNKRFDKFYELKLELERNQFIFDNKLRVIYTAGNAEPTSFTMLISEVK